MSRRGGRIQEDSASDTVYGGRAGDLYKLSGSSGASSSTDRPTKKRGDMASLLEEMKVCHKLYT